MTDRRVTATRKDEEGDIRGLCNSGEWWSPRPKSEAISDIENRTHRYFVRDDQGKEADVNVANGPSGKYLRTEPDQTSKNNLNNLPDC